MTCRFADLFPRIFIVIHSSQSLLRSSHVGFSWSMILSFFWRLQFLICFSLAMAVAAVEYRSNHTRRSQLYLAENRRKASVGVVPLDVRDGWLFPHTGFGFGLPKCRCKRNAASWLRSVYELDPIRVNATCHPERHGAAKHIGTRPFPNSSECHLSSRAQSRDLLLLRVQPDGTALPAQFLKEKV
jgi:hypothetical protein